MSEPRSGTRYVIISPVKDEERHVETTIQAVNQQTIRPVKWIVIDDGSQDRTGSILRYYAGKFDWMTVVSLIGGRRRPGDGVVRAFMAGYNLVRNYEVDFLVKLDCDLDLPADYFERLIAEFNADPALGIASGGYVAAEKQEHRFVKMEKYHAAGASKMLRAACFKDIGEFVPSLGWDTLDEIRARMAGWNTRHFDAIPFYHLKGAGAGIGTARWALLLGEINYLLGISKCDFAIKTLYRLTFGRPPIAEGGLLLLGYLGAWAQQKPRLVTEAEARVFRRMRADHLKSKVHDSLGRLSRFRWASRSCHEPRDQGQAFKP